MAEKKPNKEPKLPIDKVQAAKPKNPAAGAPNGPSPEESEVKFDFDADFAKEGSGEINLSSGSGSGLLDLSLPADDTSLGGALEDIYELEQKPQQPSKKVLQARASLETKIYAHADIMSSLGYRNIGGHYYTNGVTNILFSKDKKGQPRAFVFYGYSLRKIIHVGSTMKTLQVGRNGKTTYQYFDQLAATYFKGDGVLGEGIIPNNKFSRVIFGYSAKYDPNNTDKLEPTIKAIVKSAEEKDQKMKLQIENDLGQGTRIIRISGQAAFDLYRLGVDKYRHLKDMGLIAKAAAPEGAGQWVDLGEAIADAERQYGGNQAASLPRGRGKPISMTVEKPSALRRLFGTIYSSITGIVYKGRNKPKQ